MLGLESAHKISGMGIDVTLIEGMPRLLPKQLDEDGSEVFREKVESLGISVICGKAVAGFEGDDKGHVRYVRMNDDTLLDADVVVAVSRCSSYHCICQDSGMDIERF